MLWFGVRMSVSGQSIKMFH